MKAALRCAGYLLLWGLVLPLYGVVSGYFSHRYPYYGPPRSDWVTPVIVGLVLLGALWIYWKQVPRAPNWPLRLLYLALYLGALFLVAAASVQVAFVLVLALFGA